MIAGDALNERVGGLMSIALRESQAMKTAQRDARDAARRRRAAVEELRKLKVSYGSIAAHLGITRGGVQTILRSGD